MAKADFYTVRASFVGTFDGEPVEFHKGEVVVAGDPALRKWPDSFEPLVVRTYRPEVEQATAAPGEKRGA